MPYKVTQTAIEDVLLLEPTVHSDTRGFFMESFNEKDFERATNIKTKFVQDNHSKSKRGVLRGLHYQIEKPQGKLVRVARGSVFDVAVDLRSWSSTFGNWVGYELSETNHKQLWVPPGCAHGFLVLSETADFLYKTTEYYYPSDERCIMWDDPDLSIKWPVGIIPELSDKDLQGKNLSKASTY